MQAQEGGDALLDHDVALVFPPAKEFQCAKHEGVAIWAKDGVEAHVTLWSDQVADPLG